MPTFSVSGLFFPDSAEHAGTAAAEQAFSEHLSHISVRVHLAGPLFDKDAARVGWLLVVEAKSFEDVVDYLAKSPFSKLYQSTFVYEIRLEVGKVG